MKPSNENFIPTLTTEYETYNNTYMNKTQITEIELMIMAIQYVKEKAIANSF